MTIEQVIKLFVDKEETPCPLTERLVGAGYQQKSMAVPGIDARYSHQP